MYPCVWECVDVSMWASVSVGVAACVGYLCVGVHAFM